MTDRFDSDEGDDVMAEINMTPLVDVMLVLLIIFIITVPVIQHAVKLDLPRAQSARQDPKPATIAVSIQSDGRIYWDRQPVALEALEARLGAAAARDPQPELHLRVDRSAAYDHVARLLAAASRHGLTRLAFVTDPQP